MFASSYMISLVYLILCCGRVQPEVSVKVSPERSQHFVGETISLSCEDDGKPVYSWSVRRNAACDEWGKTEGESCTIPRPYVSDSGGYCCQSKTGGVSRSINIAISDVILESPVHPVPEGSEVTLRCLSLDKTTGKPSSDLPAHFQRNGSLIRAESTGQMTILNVSKSDEGFYKCYIYDLGVSLEIWMEVATPVSPPKMTPVPLGYSEFVYFQVAELCVLLVVFVGFYIYYKMKTRRPPKQDPLYCNMVVMETQ